MHSDIRQRKIFPNDSRDLYWKAKTFEQKRRISCDANHISHSMYRYSVTTKGGMSSKTVSPSGFNDEVFWVGMVDIMVPVQCHYYSNSNRFSS